MAKFSIIGLGNPGEAYNNTRHNVGFWLIDSFAQKNNLVFQRHEKSCTEIAKLNFSNDQAMLIKPMNFMNESGVNLPSILRLKGFGDSKTIVLHDEMTLSLGRVKITQNRGSAGHNGVKSIIDSVGHNFTRLRIGIGSKKIAQQTLADYVLSKFSAAEKCTLESKKSSFFEIIESLIRNGTERTMNFYNQTQKTETTS